LSLLTPYFSLRFSNFSAHKVAPQISFGYAALAAAVSPAEQVVFTPSRPTIFEILKSLPNLSPGSATSSAADNVGYMHLPGLWNGMDSSVRHQAKETTASDAVPSVTDKK
jgi:hypothetical protein